MLKEIDKEYIKNMENENISGMILYVLDELEKEGHKCIIKEKDIEKGKFIVIYIYDEKLHRYFLGTKFQIE